MKKEAKKEAKKLVEKMTLSHGIHFDDAKECALICVDRNIKLLMELHQDVRTKSVLIEELEVKEQIELLKQ